MNDRLVVNGRVINVYSGEILPANIAIAGGRISYVGPSQPAAREVIDAEGAYIVPGFIEPHAHPWLLYNPVTMLEGILPGGTTTIFNDDLFFYLQAGPDGFARMLDALAGLPVRYRWLVRLASQSSFDGEAEAFALDKLKPLLARPEVAGSAEYTRWPDLFRGESCALAKVGYVKSLGKRRDGHTAGASYEKLAAIRGISACHEAISAQEVLDRLRLGYWTILRHSSLRPDLPELAKAVTEHGADTRRMMLTVDGPAPRFIAEGGFIDEALRHIVAEGVPPVTAIQMATINPATYYGMDEEIGGIAPGRFADLVFLPDLHSFRASRVLFEGRDPEPLPRIDWEALGMTPRFADPRLDFTPGDLPVIEFVSNVITRAGSDGELLAVLADREGRWMTRARLRNFAPRLDALATTYNTTTHLLVIGRDPEAMRRAADRVIRMRGGIAFPDWQFALPIAGMMSSEPFAETVSAQREIERRVREAGFPFADILYSLLFLTCDFLPGLRLTPRGVLDVKSGRILRGSAHGPAGHRV